MATRFHLTSRGYKKILPLCIQSLCPQPASSVCEPIRIRPAPVPSPANPERACNRRPDLFCERQNFPAVAPPRLIRASVCRDETPAAPSTYPFANPACSISHAAGIFTCPHSQPGPAGNRGGSFPLHLAIRAACSSATTGILEEASRAAAIRIAFHQQHALVWRMRRTASATSAQTRLALSKDRCRSA